MDKDKAILAVVLIGGAALYVMSTQKKCNCNCKSKNFNHEETVKEMGKEIKSASETVAVQSAMPSFGRPLNILTPKKQQPVFQNYIDVQKNAYFKPKTGAFYR